MTVKQLNLLRVYHQATADELLHGMTWYRSANEEADRLACEHGLTIQQTAGMIAAVSPGLRFERNIEAAERIIRGEKLDGLGVRWFDGVRKARKIKRGHNPDVVLKGNKVKSFYNNILNPATSLAVTVDGHMYSCWCGRRVTLDDVPPIKDQLYYRISGDFAEVAADLAILPMQMQAVCWVVWRRMHNVTKHAVQE